MALGFMQTGVHCIDRGNFFSIKTPWSIKPNPEEDHSSPSGPVLCLPGLWGHPTLPRAFQMALGISVGICVGICASTI